MSPSLGVVIQFQKGIPLQIFKMDEKSKMVEVKIENNQYWRNYQHFFYKY